MPQVSGIRRGARNLAPASGRCWPVCRLLARPKSESGGGTRAEWLAVHPRADAAAGFRAGWARLARSVRPKLREWEARWWRMARENDRLRARLGSALREISRLSERDECAASPVMTPPDGWRRLKKRHAARSDRAAVDRARRSLSADV